MIITPKPAGLKKLFRSYLFYHKTTGNLQAYSAELQKKAAPKSGILSTLTSKSGE
jgi:hypothetical protein